jgi:hypothetical protein
MPGYWIAETLTETGKMRINRERNNASSYGKEIFKQPKPNQKAKAAGLLAGVGCSPRFPFSLPKL